jgi:hypothetical protein
MLAVLVTACFPPTEARAQTIPNDAAIDAEVNTLMTRTSAKGMAVAVIDHGKVGYVHAYGIRNTNGDPLTIDTVMYGASLTKTVFAYAVMQLVDQGKLKLDIPMKEDLDNPLPFMIGNCQGTDGVVLPPPPDRFWGLVKGQRPSVTSHSFARIQPSAGLHGRLSLGNPPALKQCFRCIGRACPPLHRPVTARTGGNSR